MARDSRSLRTALIVVAIGIVGFTVWDVWHVRDTADKTLSESTQTQTPASSSRLTHYRFPAEKLGISYDKDWKQTDANQTPTSCGQSDNLTLQNSSFSLNFKFGSICGKGSAACFDDATSGCRTESKAIATVHLSPTKQAYILAYRTTLDSGATWSYALGLTDAASCTSDFCTYKPLNLQTSGGSTVSGSYTAGSKQFSNLQGFISAKEVQQAITVLKTARY